jgi:chromatin segregation and condensation protein Rec8/ScpA/Scc1 (kleisin family)
MMLPNEDDEWEIDDDDDFSWDDDDDDEEEEDLSDIPDFEEEEEEEKTPQQNTSPAKPGKVNYAEVRIEKRPARLDITKNSEEDSRIPNRHTKGDLEDQVKKDYKYMKAKGYFMVQPFLIMDEYPFKTKNSDSDIPRSDGKNVEEDLVLVIGRLPKFKSIEEFKGKP